MQDLLQSRVETIKNGIIAKRGDSCKSFLESAGFCFGKEAKRLGLVDAVVDSPEVYLIEKFGKDVLLQMKRPDWKEKIGLGTQIFDLAIEDDKTLADELEDFCAVKVLAQIPDIRI